MSSLESKSEIYPPKKSRGLQSITEIFIGHQYIKDSASGINDAVQAATGFDNARR